MKYAWVSFLGAALGLLFSAHSVFALTVSPVKLEEIGDPGETLTGEISLYNEENKPVTYYSSFETFEAQGESGTPVFTTGYKDLSSWLSTQDSVTLQPNEVVKLPYTISIPADAEPGGHYAAIFWTTTPPEAKEDTVSIGAKVGILVLLSVKGDVVEQGDFLGFGTENNQTRFDTLPVNFWYRFQNNGGDRVKPTGTITVKNTFGLTASEFNANPSDGNVLPKSIRRLTASWLEKDHWGTEVKLPDDKSFLSMAFYEFQHFRLGRYTAKLHLEYGTEGKVAEAKIHFLIIPWHALVLIIPTLFVLLILGIIFLKRYNRWIIRKAHGTTQA